MTKSILIVEDDPLINWATVSLLEAEGYRVHSAQSKKEAIDQLAAMEAPRAIITDYFLPDGTGLELIHHAHTSISATIPVVLLTGAAPSEIKLTDYPGNCTVLNKPVRFVALNDALRQKIGFASSDS